MNPEIKAQWLRDLRSAEYQQGYEFLKRTGTAGVMRWCCLGVLCDQAEKAGIVTSHVTSGQTWTFEASSILAEASQCYPPAAVAQWCEWPENVSYGTLAEMNDSYGYKFAEVANWIEVNL